MVDRRYASGPNTMLVDQYAQHLTREGELKPAERAWQTANDTYGFSRGLGISV
jgi:uncharacterized membrane protein YkgB